MVHLLAFPEISTTSHGIHLSLHICHGDSSARCIGAAEISQNVSGDGEFLN